MPSPWYPARPPSAYFELPAEENAKRRWVNPDSVQYVEATAKDVRLVYGGGAFGAGHDARIPVASLEEAQTVLEKLGRIAAACR